MVKSLILAFVFCLSMWGNISVSAAVQEGVVILCYHDVAKGSLSNPWAVSKQNLEAQFAYLKDKGYQPITLEQYIAANKQGTTLPEKPVLLTFDDGYLSFYTEVFPLLQKYNYPAVLAVVTSWMNYAPSDVGKMVNWQQMREMEATGLVSIASHSHDLHHAVLANRHNDSSQAGSTLIYRNGRYEDIEEYKIRLATDLRQAQSIYEQELGHKVKALVWPYGEYTQFAIDMGLKEGFEVFLALGGGFNTIGEKSLREARRGIIYGNPTLEQFGTFLNAGGKDDANIRAAQMDIDLIYDPNNPRQTDNNLRMAIDRFYRSGINTVILQAFTDTGDGNIESVYFHTTAAPVKADVFDHIARRLRAEGFRVYAWMPTMAGQWLMKDHPEDVVVAYNAANKGWYNRATPFSKNVQVQLQMLFTDLAAYSSIDGVLFQDDMYMNDFEDFSPAAKQAFREQFSMELTPQALQDPMVKRAWMQMKTEAMTDLTKTLITTVRQYKPNAVSARNIYAEAVLNPAAQEWFAQDYRQYLQTYDYTVIMAYPFMEKQGKQSVKWLTELAEAALIEPSAANKVIFKIQTYDWANKRWIPNKELAAEIKALKAKGALHIGYYPENVYEEKTGLLPY